MWKTEHQPQTVVGGPRRLAREDIADKEPWSPANALSPQLANYEMQHEEVSGHECDTRPRYLPSQKDQQAT